MRLALPLFIILVAGSAALAAPASTERPAAFAEGWFENAQRALTEPDAVDRPPADAGFPTNRVTGLDPRGVALWAGGSVGAVEGETPAATVEIDGRRITVHLAASAFGQIVAGPLGYPGADVALRSEAAGLVREGADYRYRVVNGQPIGLQGGAFDIRFPGAIRPTGELVPPGDVAINYFEDRIRDAAVRFRSALRVNPFDGEAARGLVGTYEERIVPLNFAGNAALVALLKARLGNPNALLREVPLLTQAIGFFRQGALVMAEATGHPSDGPLIENEIPHLHNATTNEVGRLVDTYLRGVAQWAEAQLQRSLLSYQAEYRDPLRGEAPSSPLLADLDAGVAELQTHLLLGGVFRELPVFAFTDAPKAVAVLQDLGRLRDAIVRGQINFVAGSGGANSPAGTALGRRYGEFTTEYTPFFAGENSSDNRSNYQRAAELAAKLVADAGQLEGVAASRIATLETAAYDNQVVQEDLRARYNGELVELCGSYAPDAQGNPIPDLLFAMLPPGDRERLGRETLGEDGYPAGFGTGSGLLYQQWIAVGSARTRLGGASSELDRLFREMQQKQDTATRIANGQRRIAYLIQGNGEKIVALDHQQGEVQADISSSLADVQSNLAWQHGLVSSAGGLAKGIAGLFGNAPAAAEGFASAGSSIANGFLSAAAARESGRIQADGARRLAEIQAQKDRIAALERAEIQFEGANETELRLAEALFTLALQTERQRLNIRLARQDLALEEDKLATLFARTGRLVNDFFRAAALRDQNDPRLSPDYRLARDAAVRQAEDGFVLAQQWCFVAAQAFHYLDNRPEASSTNYVARVLRSRNAAALGEVLNHLRSDEATLRSTYQSSRAYKAATVSLRHQIVQHNRLRDPAPPVEERYVFEPTPTGVGHAASRAAWIGFLRDHLVTDARGNPRSLSIPFALSLDSILSPDLGLQLNPLHDETLLGLLIYAGNDASGNSYRGVRVNLATDGLPVGGSFSGGTRAAIAIDLEQRGHAVIRSSAHACDGSNIGLRVFNFPAFAGRVDASINNLEALGGSDAFQERSPANTEWVLTVRGDTSPNNGLLLRNLDLIEDIELQFFTRGFQDQNCLTPPRP